jgi:AraC family transcriptional regulator
VSERQSRDTVDRHEPGDATDIGFAGGRSWRHISAARVQRTVDEVLIPGGRQHLILVNIGRPFRLEERLDGRLHLTSGRPGDVAVIPAGLPTEFRRTARDPVDVQTFAMLLDPALLRALAERAGTDPAAIDLIGSLGGQEPAIERIAAALAQELRRDGPIDDLYVESLATGLAAHLLREHTEQGRRTSSMLGEEPPGGLSAAQVRRVTDYIEAHLEHGISLADLAAVANLSAFHFARTFKAATGVSPHQYVMGRRMERAKRLLTTTDLTLAEIALLCGFADQSHLARQTRRLLGTTPSALRASRR